VKNSREIRQFIRDHRYFWWWVPEEAKERLGLTSIVEATLNYGDLEDIKQLFQLVGIETVARIFRKQLQQQRSKYSPRTKHFFRIYFDRHVS
jgi:hypothetical protein